jgi:hypothetical protein
MFDEEGFDHDAHAIIEHRRVGVLQFIHDLALTRKDETPFGSEQEVALRQTWQEQEAVLERSIYLVLAQQLGFCEIDRHIRRRRLEREGLLNPTWAGRSERSQKLIEQRVTHLLDQSDESVSNQARNLVLAWCAYGSLGLLTHSEYPCVTELVMLQKQIAELDSSAIKLPLAQLRADLIALYRTLHDPSLLALVRTPQKPRAQLWDQSLLHQPAKNDVRKRYQERMASDIRSAIVSHLGHQRGCSAADAARLFNTLVADGLSGLIAWRTEMSVESARQEFDRRRVEQATVGIIHSLPADIRQLIITRLDQLQDAMIATDVSFSIFPLIRDLPSTKRRRKRQRRTLPEALALAFATRASISEGQALSCIKNLMIYGPLGMLPKRDWSHAFHPSIWSYLHLCKLGRLEGTIDHATLVERVDAYARSLGSPPLHRQLIVGVFNHFPKPNTYNSGDGDAIAGVPLRAAIKLQDVARLHERWLLIPITLEIQIVDALLHPISDTCSVTLVLDWGSQCPMAAWPSSHPPNMADANLALYQSIFHPGALYWPLRGLPETILLPATFAGDKLPDLQRSAQLMMAKVEIVADHEEQLAKLPRIQRMVEDLKAAYQPPILPGRRRGLKQRMTIKQLHDTLLTWLHDSCFATHRSEPVIRHLRKQGMALPGFDTAVAGWLLPVTGTVQTIQDGVRDGLFRYSSPVFHSEPGWELKKREFPYTYEGMKRFMFIEDDGMVHYVTYHPS